MVGLPLCMKGFRNGVARRFVFSAKGAMFILSLGIAQGVRIVA